jgi:biopolymer transport protein ExbD
MARSFHRRRTLAPLADINVTNLIDLGFTLLIIFMISTPLIQNERTIPVDLPVSTEAASRSPELRFIDVVIEPSGYNVDGVMMDRAQLESHMRSFTGSRNPPVFSIRANRNIAYQEVVTVLDLLKRNNLTKISLDTQSGR